MNALTTPTQVVLALVCILLLGAITYEIAAPLPEPALPAAAPDTRPIATPPLPVFHPPPSENFDEINARPVFDRARAPIAADTTTSIGSFSGSSTSPPAVSLVGIIIDGPRRIAMIRSSVAPVATSVSLGDSIQGWKVDEIDPDRIVLRSGSDKAEVRLSQSRSPNAAGATATPPGFGPRPSVTPGAAPGAVVVPPPGAVMAQPPGAASQYNPVAAPPDRTPH